MTARRDGTGHFSNGPRIARVVVGEMPMRVALTGIMISAGCVSSSSRPQPHQDASFDYPGFDSTPSRLDRIRIDKRASGPAGSIDGSYVDGTCLPSGGVS